MFQSGVWGRGARRGDEGRELRGTVLYKGRVRYRVMVESNEYAGRGRIGKREREINIATTTHFPAISGTVQYTIIHNIVEGE